jgi:phosphatidylinositol alpha-1,6-mannosyltransferase
MIENKKYHVLGNNAKEYVSKFQWDKILEEYKKILD